MNENNISPYVSCIKVKGIHLLPPVITPEQSLQLRSYKQQAVKLEKRLRNFRDLKRNLQDLLDLQPLSDRPQSEITFRDDESHVEALGISENNQNITKTVRLSHDIVDVTQYDNDGIKVIRNESDTIYETDQGRELAHDTSNETYESDTSLNKSSEIKLGKRPIELDFTEGNEKKVNETSPTSMSRPRLIRSNSYTLETPSPILIAHMKKKNDNSKEEILESFKNLSFSRNWSSTENTYVPFEKSEKTADYELNFNDAPVVTEAEVKSTPILAAEKLRAGKSPSSTIEVIHTDISLQQITVNADDSNIEKTATQEDDLQQLMLVLRKIPDEYSREIVELIRNQKSNQSTRESFERFKKRLESSDRDETKLRNEKNIEDSFIQSENNLTISPNNLFTFTKNSKSSNSDSLKVVDLDSEKDCLGLDLSFDDPKRIVDVFVRQDARTNRNIGRELFPVTLPNKVNLKKEMAASIIGAHVKGFLTRRLLKTEKVQILINTIKDALMCALQLHRAENIDESDVELHRRLINQVSAACYAFHDIFFSLPVPEQMGLIAADRQRRIEKAKRPPSSQASNRSRPSSERSSKSERFSRSLTRQKVQTPNSQSLTKV